MKKILFAVMAVLLAMVSCTDGQFLDETVGNPTELSSTNELNTLIEKARWGDGQAFVKLADCYRDGKGVKQDFVGMLAMLSQADEYGGISNMEDYLKTLPEGSDFKLIFDAIENYEKKNMDEATSVFEQLTAKGSPDGYAIQGIITMERGDTLEGGTFDGTGCHRRQYICGSASVLSRLARGHQSRLGETVSSFRQYSFYQHHSRQDIFRFRG
jgi:hypothetical protein